MDSAKALLGAYDEELTKELSALFVPQTLKELASKYKVLHSLMQYQGFDPRQMAKILITLWKEDKVRRKDAGEEEGEGVAFEEDINKKGVWNPEGSFLEDMYFLVSTFLIRGSAIEKIEKKSTEAMVSILDKLTTKYAISKSKRKAGSALDPKTVTLPRICATFPVFTVDIFTRCTSIRYLVDPSTIFRNTEKIPRALWSPMISSVIPPKLVPKRILFTMALATDNLLHEKPAERTSPLRLVEYLEASMKSTATKDSEKVKRCVDWKILAEGSGKVTLNDNIIELEESIGEEIWDDIRPGYKKWDEIMEKL